MPNKYRLFTNVFNNYGVYYGVYKNETLILAPTTKEKAEKYIKFNKQKDQENRTLNKSFEINSICRNDLKEYIEEKQVLKLTNQEMKNISRLMGEYMQEDYWTCLTEALDRLEIKTIEN